MRALLPSFTLATLSLAAGMVAAASLSPSDSILHSISNPSKATPDLPSRLARLLGLPPPPSTSTAHPLPSKAPFSRSTAAAPRPTARSTSTSKTKASSSSAFEALEEGEGRKLAMRVVNGSLQSLTSLAQSAWSPSSGPPKPSTSPPNPFKTSPPTLGNVLAIVGCAHVALSRLRRARNGEGEVSVERAAVSFVARCNALGLVSATVKCLVTK